MAQTGTGQTAHTFPMIFSWASGVTLDAAIAAELTTRSTTWGAKFSTAPGSTQLVRPWLRMPLIRIYTSAANGVLLDDQAGTNAPLVQNQWFGPITIENTSYLSYTGASSAVVFLEC